MKRLTVDKTAREMSGVELAHNCMYARDRWARYRDFDKDMDLFDFIREFANAEKTELPADNEVVAEMLLDGLQYSIGNPFGRVALVYNLMWAMADLRETLKAYEDTGLTPEEIMDGRMLTGWIPVNERLPECEKEVLIQTARGTITTAIYEDGNMPNENSIWYWTDVDFDYVEETDTEYVPEGWWEYRHFNPDDVYNNAIDEDVVAWMPLPKLYKTKRGLKGKGERGMKRLTVGELRTALEGLPDDLVIEIADGAGGSRERILEYIKQLRDEENECDTL